MGPGGISVMVTKVGAQKTAYVTIDGNNMISGLREKILTMLQEIGIVDGEILTTDTHAVTGVVPTARGYYPIGEAIDHAKLISYIREATGKALDDLTPAEVSRRTGMVPNVKVIGEKPIADLCVLVEEAMKQAKRLAFSLFSAAGFLLIGLLMLI
jgi:putative membrane protein